MSVIEGLLRRAERADVACTNLSIDANDSLNVGTDGNLEGNDKAVTCLANVLRNLERISFLQAESHMVFSILCGLLEHKVFNHSVAACIGGVIFDAVFAAAIAITDTVVSAVVIFRIRAVDFILS